jgi:dTDP-4-dehydrorhamnose reductase
VDLQENIIRRLKTRIKHYVFVSSTRVYGQVNACVDDETTIDTCTDEKTLALLAAEECTLNHPCSTIVRCSGIYDEKRNPFLTFALSEREDGLDQYTNRIHKTDIAKALFHIADKEGQGVYLASDLNPITRRQFREWVKGPKKVDASESSYGKRCIPKRLLSEGFQFSYPDCRIP